jgi:hypothetical protein
MDGSRQLLQSPLDSYWQLGPKASLGWHAGPRDDLTLSYQWSQLAYDHEPALGPHGNTWTNSHLVIASQLVLLAWDHAWDARNRWHSTLGAGVGTDQDNGSSFFNRTKYSMSSKLEYCAGRWKLVAALTAADYAYPVQTVPLSGGPHRTKTWLSASARAEWKVTKVLKLLATYNFARSFSNLDIDDYYTHTMSMGVELEF